MRILWFSPTPSLYRSHSNSHNGGGWVASLETIVRDNSSIELGIAFMLNEPQFKEKSEGVTYYPINPEPKSFIDKLLRRPDHSLVEKYLKIIEDFKPDLIQIFGSENDFGSICSHTNIPVVIHMQGCLPPYHNALFPVGMNTTDFLWRRGLNRQKRLMGLLSDNTFAKRAEREIQTIQSCNYFMGRTEWDKALVSLFNPKAQYFHCEEALRNSFLTSDRVWSVGNLNSDKVKIISVISNPWYKGMDLILKTAKLLNRFTDMDFEWNVYGVSDIKFYEYKYKIKAKEVAVNICGSVDKNHLITALLASSCYVHTSYIDNSPNTICEAQILGLPILATNVGGVSSLIKDGETGILFPANDPYMLSHLICKLTSDVVLAHKISDAAINQARERHNYDSIKSRLNAIYKQILT